MKVLLIFLIIVPFKTTAQNLNRLSVANYTLTFQSTWSATTHPEYFPSNPHYSGLIGATHNSDITIWEVDQLASAGIENMAETGSKQPLSSEIESSITSGMVDKVLSGGGIGLSPGSVILEFQINSNYPLVSLVSMLAPSPDWFVGVSSLNLFEQDQWLDDKVVELFVYDAGTDSGPMYTSPNLDTQPPENIKLIETAPFLVDGTVKSVGSFTFKRTGVVPIEDNFTTMVDGYSLQGAFPNPFNSQTNFNLTLAERQNVRIEIYDLIGRRISLLFDGMIEAQERRRFIFQSENRPSGTYLIRVSGENFSVIRKVFLIK